MFNKKQKDQAIDKLFNLLKKIDEMGSVSAEVFNDLISISSKVKQFNIENAVSFGSVTFYVSKSLPNLSIAKL